MSIRYPPSRAAARLGFGLLDVLLALVVVLVGSVAMARLGLATADAVALGRRWTAMAAAAESELVRLEREFRIGRPGCAPPSSGSRVTADGVGLTWSVGGDSLTARVVLEVRAKTSRRSLFDSVATTLSCR